MKKKLRPLIIFAVFFALLGFSSYFTITNSLYGVSRLPVRDRNDTLSLVFNPQNLSSNDSTSWDYEGYCVSTIKGSVETIGDVTLCTQGTPEFLYHLCEQCRRWQGPISAAVYSFGENLQPTELYIEKLRHCDPCVNRWVTWHVFHKNITGCFFPEKHIERNTSYWNCSDLSVSDVLKKTIVPYPINVARNIARKWCKTNFILSLDIELYPNLNVSSRFLRMVSREPTLPQRPLRVWVLPVFEVPLGVQPPVDKTTLRRLFLEGNAISFHKFRCDMCHKIPHLKEWIGKVGSEEELRVFETVKRNKGYKLQDWEPFFISTKAYPMFDPRLTWNGKLNKMQVAYEMCMLNYDFHILDDAFLVHSPGINRYNASKEKAKARYIAQNNRIFRSIKRNLTAKYPDSKGC